MNIEKTIKSLQRNGYKVFFFETKEEAADYLDKTIENKTIGFGGSRTLLDMNLKNILGRKNKVMDPDHPDLNETFRSTALKAMDADIFFLSANGLSENGEIVNIDATGNRLAGSLFGHKKVVYVIRVNKIEENLEKTIWRVRNVASPKNAMRFKLRTPCAIKGDKCYDCQSPDRICNSLLIHLKASDAYEAEVILINENLGF